MNAGKYSLSDSGELRAWGATLLGLLPLSWLLFHGFFSILAACIALGALFIISQIDKKVSITVILGFLFCLGDIRRFVGMFVGFPQLDPLLLVGPIISAIIAIPLLLRLRLKDPLSKAMVAFMAVMVLEIVNPRQGPISVGLGGAIFYLVPMLWFWIGRRFGTNELLNMVIYRVLIPLAVIASLVGLCQTYVGFFPWQQAWIDAVASHYHSLNLGGGFIRAFGFSVNGVEYACLELMACSCVLAAFFAGRRGYALLVPLLTATLFLASSRTAIVKLIFAVAVAWAISSRGGKGWVVRLPLALAVLFGTLAFSLGQISSVSSGAPTAQGLSTQHQIEGLQHPLDSKKSTAGLHIKMFLGGFAQGLSYPIGSGLGSVTLSSTRLGGSDAEVSGSTEVDISDAFVSMGLVGGLLYLYIIYVIIRRAVNFGRTAPRYLGLPTLALLAAMVGNWIALGQYATGPLIWFLIGSLARHNVEAPQPNKMRTRVRTTTIMRHQRDTAHAYPSHWSSLERPADVNRD